MSRNKSVSLVTVTIILLFELCTILHGEDEVTEGEERELLHLKDTYYFFVFYPYIPSLSIEMYRDPRILCFDSDAKDDGYVSNYIRGTSACFYFHALLKRFFIEFESRYWTDWGILGTSENIKRRIEREANCQVVDNYFDKDELRFNFGALIGNSFYFGPEAGYLYRSIDNYINIQYYEDGGDGSRATSTPERLVINRFSGEGYGYRLGGLMVVDMSAMMDDISESNNEAYFWLSGGYESFEKRDNYYFNFHIRMYPFILSSIAADVYFSYAGKDDYVNGYFGIGLGVKL